MCEVWDSGAGSHGWDAIVFQQFWTFASSPLIEGWGQGSESRLKRCFCTQAWHHNSAATAGGTGTGPATRQGESNMGTSWPSLSQSHSGQALPTSLAHPLTPGPQDPEPLAVQPD